MSIRIDLSNHLDKFAANSREFSIEKKINFVFGKNGTGKTTIADEIYNQLSGQYDVCVFKDFDGIVENARLDAVALGTENAEIQKKIDSVDAEILEIEKEAKQPENKHTENLFTKAAEARKKAGDFSETITVFFTSAAQQIKNLTNPSVAKTTYNKNDFESDIPKAALLSEANVTIHKNTIKADKKADVNKVVIPEINLTSYLDLTNELLQSSVAQPQDIPELKDNAEKQSFARQGMNIHVHEEGEVCAFCGNEISNQRWQLLGNYFNEEVKKLEGRINSGLEKIQSALTQINNIEEIEADNYYDMYSENVKNINLQLKARRGEYKEFLEHLKIALEGKREKLFSQSDTMEIVAPESFAEIKKAWDDLVEFHNELSKNLKQEQDKAKDALRYHQVKKKLNEFKYDEEKCKLLALKAASSEARNLLNAKKEELLQKQDERKDLIIQTKDEEKIAININRLLSNMGVASFSLELVSDDDENQKGQYRIRGHNNQLRPVTHLSKGEKNIIAFLYFLFSLESIGRNDRHRIIVLDDPMTSNDDTMQYLMIGEIQKLFSKINDGNYLIILTHNCHFYLNIRPNIMPTYKKSGDEGLYKEIGFYEKYGVTHLFSDGKHATIKNITNGKQDFKTNYETLWKELVFLYDADAPDLMLNPCRKICETYLKFTKQDVMKFYGDNINAKKLFDVNQHSVDDLEAEQNGKTKEEIKSILSELFKSVDAEEHFKSHWQGGSK